MNEIIMKVNKKEDGQYSVFFLTSVSFFLKLSLIPKIELRQIHANPQNHASHALMWSPLYFDKPIITNNIDMKVDFY